MRNVPSTTPSRTHPGSSYRSGWHLRFEGALSPSHRTVRQTSSILDAQVTGSSRMHNTSLTATTMPASRPARPSARRRSMSRARSSARSSKTVRNAFRRVPLRMLRRNPSVTRSHEVSPCSNAWRVSSYVTAGCTAAIHPGVARCDLLLREEWMPVNRSGSSVPGPLSRRAWRS
jgi:hypothetical protein